jgi:hypothetical protein
MQKSMGLPLVRCRMDITEMSPIAVLFAVVAMAGIFVFFSRAASTWSRLAVLMISGFGAIVGCLLIAFLIFRGKPEERVIELENGRFKILVRSQEFRHSGSRNLDICVAETSSRSFPKSRMQCFFDGFDFSGLSVAWRSQHDIEVSFRSGYLTHFENTAVVLATGSSVPESFHTTVHDGESETSIDAGKAVPRLNVQF